MTDAPEPAIEIDLAEAERLADDAAALVAEQRLKESFVLLHRASELVDRSEAPDRPRLRRALRTVGRIYQSTGKLQEAETSYRRLLESFHDGSPAERAALLHDLAVVSEAMGRADEAEALWGEARSLVDGPAELPG